MGYNYRNEFGISGFSRDAHYEREDAAMAEVTESKNFIHAFIEEDIAEGGQFAGKTVHTRKREGR